MTQIAIPGAAEFAVDGYGPNSVNWSMVFGVGRRGSSTTAFSDANVTAILGAIQAWAETTLLTVMSSEYGVSLARGRDVSQVPYGNAQEVELSGAGGMSGDPLPPQSALVVTKLTPFSGRRFRGRFYHPSIVEGVQAAGIVTEAFRSDVNDAYEDLRTALDVADPGGWALSVLSRISPTTKVAVTSLRTNARIDAQRRRAGRT